MHNSTPHYDVLILGAGGAGLMCAGRAAQRGLSVAVLDHAKKPGEKIRISGGGRCNFTNTETRADRFLSADPRFCEAALKGYTAQDFVSLVKKHRISFHEKTLGQLFCDESAQQIIDMLLQEMRHGGAELFMSTGLHKVAREGDLFVVTTDKGVFTGERLVVATGGKSIPKMGATGFGYKLAEQFGLRIEPTRPGLVPFTFDPTLKETYAPLAGLATEALVTAQGPGFREALLFTHRGLSGPAVLQASSYWVEGQPLLINLAPDNDLYAQFIAERDARPRGEVSTVLSEFLPKRLAKMLAEPLAGHSRLADQSNKSFRKLADEVNCWQVVPVGTEGYRTAEVTVGGVATTDLAPDSLMAKQVPGLYFIGEVVDVTGWLGGYNFQWAWSSAVAAARAF
ncbi:MAG: NAD(P)/FAD-dependent oxidoreductase [Parvibaculum sp.]